MEWFIELGACKSNEWRRGRKFGGEDLCNPLETIMGRGKEVIVVGLLQAWKEFWVLD